MAHTRGFMIFSRGWKRDNDILPRGVLVLMKISSVLNRNKDDKRIKDTADIYSLMWYSDIKFSDLRQNVQKIYDTKKIASTISNFTDHDYRAVSKAIDIDKDEISRVIAELAK